MCGSRAARAAARTARDAAGVERHGGKYETCSIVIAQARLAPLISRARPRGCSAIHRVESARCRRCAGRSRTSRARGSRCGCSGTTCTKPTVPRPYGGWRCAIAIDLLHHARRDLQRVLAQRHRRRAGVRLHAGDDAVVPAQAEHAGDDADRLVVRPRGPGPARCAPRSRRRAGASPRLLGADVADALELVASPSCRRRPSRA